jgi:hypothetical protein
MIPVHIELPELEVVCRVLDAWDAEISSTLLMMALLLPAFLITSIIAYLSLFSYEKFVFIKNLSYLF